MKEQKNIKHDCWAHLRTPEDKIYDIESWNFDVVAVVLLAPRLRQFIKKEKGCPAMENWTTWHAKLNKMQYAFDKLESIINPVSGIYEYEKLTDKQKRKIKAGLKLFGEKLLWLWI
jgi:hypothetical protein